MFERYHSRPSDHRVPMGVVVVMRKYGAMNAGFTSVPRLIPIALLLAACGATPMGGTPHNTAAPSASPAKAPQGPWNELLTFAGPVTGSVTAGNPGDTAVCSGAQSIPGHFLEVHFDVVLAGTTYHVVFHVRYLAGPGSTPIDDENVQATLTSTDFSPPGPPPNVPGQTPSPPIGSRYAATGGTLTIASSGDSGSIAATMGSATDFSGTAPPEQVSGSWSCRTLPPPPGSTSEGLAFSGGVNGQMTVATPDPAAGGAPAVCTLPGPGTQFRGILIQGVVQGSRWKLLFGLGSNVLAAGAYSGTGSTIFVELDPGTGNPAAGNWLNDAKATDPDRLTINPGMASGTLDLIAHPSSASNGAPVYGSTQVHITGSFTCVPTATPST